jgi:hypothetical protein
MIIREQEPAVVYTTPASDWSAANAIIALVVVAVLGVVVYYFSVMNTNHIDNTTINPAPQAPTIIQTPAATPAPVTINNPPAAPSTTNVTVTPPAADSSSSDTSSSQ